MSTRYVAKELTDENYCDAVSGKTEEKTSNRKKTLDDLQSLHLSSASSTPSETEQEKEKTGESLEIKAVRRLFLGGKAKSVIGLFKRGKKSSSPSVQAEAQEEQPRASRWTRQQVEANSKRQFLKNKHRGMCGADDKRKQGAEARRPKNERRGLRGADGKWKRGAEANHPKKMEPGSRSRSQKALTPEKAEARRRNEPTSKQQQNMVKVA